jgi:4'-phosphopantetheinyl transferase
MGEPAPGATTARRDPPPSWATGPPVRGAVAAGECELWLFPVLATDFGIDLLDPRERARLDEFRIESARRAFLVSRAAQRVVLGRYLRVAPMDVPIVRTCEACGDPAHGRPFVPYGPHYSVSHSGGWVLIAVSGGGPVGVDIEEIRPLGDLEGMRRLVLSDGEQPTGPVELGWFYRLWTRKEAVVKATGEGIVRLRSVSVSGDTATSGDSSWQLRDLPVPDGYAAALASSEPVRAVRHANPVDPPPPTA